jgi:peptidoglycan lytic transglycosylase
MKHSANLVHYAGIAGVLAGLFFGSAPGSVLDLPRVSQFAPKVELDPFRSVAHAGMLVAAHTAQARLDDGRPWAAWNAIRDFAGDDADDLPPPVALLAARAAAGWDGWSHVRRLLDGQNWLAGEDAGAGLMLLGRAEEEERDWDAAARAYRGYVRVATGSDRGVAYARLGRVLRADDRDREAADAFARAAADLPEVADWMAALRADALAAAGDPAVAGAAPNGGSSAARAWAARAEMRFRTARGEETAAAARLRREAEALVEDDPSLAAELQVQRARLLVAADRAEEVRGELRAIAAGGRVAPAVRATAASLLGDLPGDLSADEQLARAAAYEVAGKPGLAAKALRVAFARGAPRDGASMLREARLLYDEADFGPARDWSARAAEALDGEMAGEAEVIHARALIRLGAEDDGVAALRRITDRRAGTAAAGTAWFLLGDAASDRDAAIADYRRAAATASPFAREAQFRVGDRCRRAGDEACAARAWEDYAARWPRGEETAQAAYLVGVLHERAGRGDRARAMYAAAIAADPADYYAIRAADRLGADPLAEVIARPAAWSVDPADAGEAAGVVRRLAALEQAGADDAWKAELEAQQRRFADRPYALLLLAEGLRDGRHTVEAIRIGRQLLAARGGAWDERLLRVVFPFPYREILADEAERADVDPWLLAGLVRQESSFNHEARSWVGATGLSQIMPSTGAWLASAAGVRNFAPELLAVPEINLRMGARYLRDQLRRYHGARDLALAAYNAGPGRADRWKDDLGYGADVDGFREKIPFAETREYVKVVIRNAEIYRRLYGRRRSPGLAHGGGE